MQDEPLFEIDAPPPIPLLPLSAKATTFTRIKLKVRVACDECIQILHANKGIGSYAGDVKYRVKFSDGQVMLLCQRHTEARRSLPH